MLLFQPIQAEKIYCGYEKVKSFKLQNMYRLFQRNAQCLLTSSIYGFEIYWRELKAQKIKKNWKNWQLIIKQIKTDYKFEPKSGSYHEKELESFSRIWCWPQECCNSSLIIITVKFKSEWVHWSQNCIFYKEHRNYLKRAIKFLY